MYLDDMFDVYLVTGEECDAFARTWVQSVV